MSSVGSSVEARLVDAWRRERWYQHTRGLARLVFPLVGLILFDLLVDWLFDLPGLFRLLLLLVNLAVLGFIGYRGWWVWLRRYDPTRLALRVEQLHPGLNSLLVSYVQLTGTGTQTHGSPRLIEAMRQRAVEAAGPLDFRGIVDFRDLRRLVVGAASVLLLFAVSGLILGSFYAVLFARMFNPLSTLAYPTRTRIESVSGDLVVAQGEAVELEAQTSGEIPTEGRLYLQHGDSSWEKLSLSSGDGRFAHRIPQAVRSFAYQFRLGDARSPIHQVRVVPPPRLVEARVSLRFPKYMNRPDEKYNGLNLPPIPAGTEVRWHLRCDRELAAGELQPLREKSRSLSLRIADDPHQATLVLNDVAQLADDAPTLRARQESDVVSYRFRWTDRENGFVFADATRYTLEVVPDRVPVVKVVKPQLIPGEERMPATLKKRLTVHFEASDDHGLGRAWIVWKVNDGPEQRQPIGSFKERSKTGRFETVRMLRESLPGLKEGDLLHWRIEVSDNRTGAQGAGDGTSPLKQGPNLGRSFPLQMQIVSEEEYRLYVERQKERGFDRTRAAAREETESSKKVKTLIPDEEGRP